MDMDWLVAGRGVCIFLSVSIVVDFQLGVFFISLACFCPCTIGKCEVNSSEIVVLAAGCNGRGRSADVNGSCRRSYCMRYSIPNSFVSRLLLALELNHVLHRRIPSLPYIYIYIIVSSLHAHFATAIALLHMFPILDFMP